MPRASYALSAATSRGRAIDEPASSSRTAYQRDRDRIVHCVAFRRLEYKTQVFFNFEGDHFRTRLTHSLEVAQIARSLARVFDLDEDAAEAVALAHDLGHSPFGHAGERALDDSLKLFGGFDHNLQALKIVTRLERRYAEFDGLNLTAETLEGIAKHNGPVRAPLLPLLSNHPQAEALHPDLQAPLEAQLAAIADDIAYSSHDIDDGLRARFFTLEDLRSLALVGEIVGEVVSRWPNVEAERLAHETNRRLIDTLVTDVTRTTRAMLETHGIKTLDDVRGHGSPLVGFSRTVGDAVNGLRRFLSERMYNHYRVNRMTRKAQRLVTDLVDALLLSPDCLPDRWREAAGGPHTPETAAIVRDYIAGMTDRYALDEHTRLFKITRYPE